jgi:hypothetical protein
METPPGRHCSTQISQTIHKISFIYFFYQYVFSSLLKGDT